MIGHFLNNPFLNSPLGNSRFVQYTRTHLERLRAAEANGAFDALITATAQAQQALRDATQKTAAAKAKGRGKRLTNDEAVAQLVRFLSRKSGTLADLFTSPDGKTRGEDSPAYKAFYPQGAQEYGRANKATIEGLGTRYADIAAEQAEAVGAKLEKDVRALVKQVQDTRTEQLREAGTATEGSQQGQAEREALAEQLFENLLTLLLFHKRDPQAAGAYFDQGLLARRSPLPAEAPSTK